MLRVALSLIDSQPQPCSLHVDGCSPQYKARLKILPQRALNSYPPRVLDPAGWWCKGDFILHYAGFHIASKFARSIEYPNATLGAIPACRKGQEEKAWLEWVPDQP